MDLAFLVAVAAVLLVFGAISRRAERSPLTPPLAFVGVGLLLSPQGLGWLDLSPSHAVIHGLAELTLVLVLFMDAARIELSCLRREGTLPLRLLVIGLPLTILLGAAAAVAIFPGLGLAAALLSAGIVALGLWPLAALLALVALSLLRRLLARRRGDTLGRIEVTECANVSGEADDR